MDKTPLGQPDCASARLSLQGKLAGSTLSASLPRTPERVSWGGELNPRRNVWINSEQDYPSDDAQDLGLPRLDGSTWALHIDLDGATSIEDVKRGAEISHFSVLGGWIRLPSDKGSTKIQFCAGQANFVPQPGAAFSAGTYTFDVTACQSNEALSFCMSTVK